MACEEPDGSTLHAEVEQLMLAPGAWLSDSLNLFGLSLGGIQVRVTFCMASLACHGVASKESSLWNIERQAKGLFFHV